jgi:heme/copper-type cytochrome/quinol oxidase subunit 4
MAASELQKKGIYTVTVIALGSLLLFALPFVERWLQTDVLAQFGMIFDKGWELKPDPATMPMYAVYANALSNAFSIVTILIGMAIVIVLVRFIAYLVMHAVYRNSKKSEVSSLLKTISSIIVYVIAFFLIFQTQYPGI